MRRAFILCVVICNLSLGAAAQTVPESAPLVAGRAVEREITGGESHTYKISLAAGQFVRVVVEQKGIDVALGLAGPDGKPLIESDLTALIGARESLSCEIAAAGEYQVVVRAKGATILSGAYQVLLELKAASEPDRKRARAEQLLNEAARISRQKDFQQSIEKKQEALLLRRELGERRWEADTLRSVGSSYVNLGSVLTLCW